MHNLLIYWWNSTNSGAPCIESLPLYTLQVQLITNKAQLGQVAYWGANWCGYNLTPSETTDRLYAKVVNLQRKGVIKLCLFSLSLKNSELLDLVGGLEHVLQCFTYIGNDHANCLSYFSEGWSTTNHAVNVWGCLDIPILCRWVDGWASWPDCWTGEFTGRNHRPWYNHFTT